MVVVPLDGAMDGGGGIGDVIGVCDSGFWYFKASRLVRDAIMARLVTFGFCYFIYDFWRLREGYNRASQSTTLFLLKVCMVAYWHSAYYSIMC